MADDDDCLEPLTPVFDLHVECRAERDRLAAEVERLRADRDALAERLESVPCVVDEHADLAAEVERLRAEVDRARPVIDAAGPLADRLRRVQEVRAAFYSVPDDAPLDEQVDAATAMPPAKDALEDAAADLVAAVRGYQDQEPGT